MAGMPDPVETSDDVGGAGQFFKQIENWLNDPDRRQANRTAARDKVAGNFAGVPTDDNVAGPPARTLSGNPGINHFNKHWRKGPSGWWPNIPKDRVDSQMSDAFVAALNTVLAPGNEHLNIRLRWTCRELNLNAPPSAFYALMTPAPAAGVIWIDIVSPRAP